MPLYDRIVPPSFQAPSRTDLTPAAHGAGLSLVAPRRQTFCITRLTPCTRLQRIVWAIACLAIAVRALHQTAFKGDGRVRRVIFEGSGLFVGSDPQAISGVLDLEAPHSIAGRPEMNGRVV